MQEMVVHYDSNTPPSKELTNVLGATPRRVSASLSATICHHLSYQMTFISRFSSHSNTFFLHGSGESKAGRYSQLQQTNYEEQWLSIKPNRNNSNKIKQLLQLQSKSKMEEQSLSLYLKTFFVE